MKFLIMLLALTVSAHAKPTIECKTTEWKLDRNMPVHDIVAALDKMPRPEIIQLSWGEMLRVEAQTSMALPLLRYLEGTEQNQVLRGYFEYLGSTVTKDESSPSKYMAKWPARPVQAQKSTLKLADLCKYYEASLK